MKKKQWRTLKWVLMSLGAVVCGVLGCIWLLFQHVPAWYQPVEIAPDRIQSIRDDLLRTRSDFSEQLLLAKRPFEYRISQAQLNDWLTAREEIWPLSREWLPPWLSDPLLVIDQDGVRLAAIVHHGSLRTVASAKLAISAEENQIRVQLMEVRGGSLPLPHRYVLKQLQTLDRHGWNMETLGGTKRAEARLTGLLEGVSLPNSGTWVEPGVGGKTIRRKYKVIGLRLEPGGAVATIRPLEFKNR